MKAVSRVKIKHFMVITTMILLGFLITKPAFALPPIWVWHELCAQAIVQGFGGFWWDDGRSGSEWITCEHFSGEIIEVHGDPPLVCPPGCSEMLYPYGGCRCPPDWEPPPDHEWSPDSDPWGGGIEREGYLHRM